MEALAATGQFHEPSLADVERSLAVALAAARGRGRVFVDLWDLPRFASCPTCLRGRRARLHSVNLVPDDRAVHQRDALTAAARRTMTVAPVSTIDADVAVVGSGFAGSLVALALRQRGRRVVLVERGRHPRFAIGESSTPLANLLLEEFADRYDLPRIRAFSKWGTWQRTHPTSGPG